MKKLYTFVFASIFSFGAMYAQEKELPLKSNHAFYISSPMRFSYFNLDGINRGLNEAGIQSVSPATAQVGLGFAYNYKRLGAGGEAFFFGGSFSNGGRADIRSRMNTSNFHVSYAISNKGDNTIFIGLNYSLTLHELIATQNIGNVSFTQALANNGNATVVYNANNFVGLSLGVIENKASKRHAAFSFSIGYNMGLQSRQWRVLNAAAANAPSDRMNHFYFQISQGLLVKK